MVAVEERRADMVRVLAEAGAIARALPAREAACQGYP